MLSSIKRLFFPSNMCLIFFFFFFIFLNHSAFGNENLKCLHVLKLHPVFKPLLISSILHQCHKGWKQGIKSKWEHGEYTIRCSTGWLGRGMYCCSRICCSRVVRSVSSSLSSIRTRSYIWCSRTNLHLDQEQSRIKDKRECQTNPKSHF